ncbi:MAG: P-II family nitrogen regulator [Pirellulales bacterium]
MKQVIAVVKPFLAEKVLESLRLAPIEACSVREVKGFGRQKNYLDQYGDSEYSMAFLPKVEVSLWVDDSRVDEVIRQIVEVARTGRMGDGKIFVLSMQEAGTVVDIESSAAVAPDAPKARQSAATKSATTKDAPRRKSGRS